MKIIITGAHFTPAQAVIEELSAYSNVEISYIGRKSTMEGDKSESSESQVLPKMGVKFIPIMAGRLQRSFTIHTIPSLLKIPIGFVQSLYLVAMIKPDVVLSFGGYVSVPVVLAAWLLSIPVITHEQTLVMGLANQINSLLADKVAVTFEDGRKNDEKIILTGNPIRRELLEDGFPGDNVRIFFEKARRAKLPVIFVTGGNQGAHVINLAVMGALPELLKSSFLILQSGDSKFNDFNEAEKIKKRLEDPSRFLIKKWIEGHNFGYILKNADLVIGRAGINTMLECAYAGIPILVIPIPFLYRNEQAVNALFFEKLGIAKSISQRNLSSKTLLATVLTALANITRMREKAKEAKAIIIPHAAKKLAQETILLARK